MKLFHRLIVLSFPLGKFKATVNKLIKELKYKEFEFKIQLLHQQNFTAIKYLFKRLNYLDFGTSSIVDLEQNSSDFEIFKAGCRARIN